MNKIVTKQVRQNLLKGVNQLANAVEVTLGPEGRNVMIDQFNGIPHITKDGVTVAKSINISNRIQNMGVQLIRQAAEQTAKEAGDGTTTSTILARAITSKAVELIEQKNVNPILLRKGMEKAVSEFAEFLKTIAQPIKPEQYYDIAMIASNGDHGISKVVSNAKNQVGRYGQVLYSPTHRDIPLSVDITSGMQIKSGMMTKQLTKSNNVVEMTDAYIIVMAYEVISMNDINKVMQQLANDKEYIGKNLVILCDGMEGEPLSFVVTNVNRGVINVAVVRTPYANEREDYLIDICTYTGAKLISESSGLKPRDVGFEYAGHCDAIEIHLDRTVIYGGAGEPTEIKKRTEYLNKRIDDTAPDTHIHNELKLRLASFAGKIAVINIGSQNQAYLKEIQDIIDDTISAVNSATDEGFVPGGGNTLHRAKQILTGLEQARGGAYEMGRQLVLSVLDEPLKAILRNAGEETKGLLAKDFYFFKEGKLVRSHKEHPSIIDPTKVLRVAVRNAVAAASTIITTECIVELEQSFVDRHIELVNTKTR
jgi:chaperonin GroEL